jgi:hypothetical protein
MATTQTTYVFHTTWHGFYFERSTSRTLVGSFDWPLAIGVGLFVVLLVGVLLLSAFAWRRWVR